MKKLLLLLLLLLPSSAQADSKLTDLTQGTCASLYYGEEGGASRKYNGCLVFNVKDYGALGDGSADDHTAIQNAINTALNSGGGIVYFPTLKFPNCYKNNSSLTFGGGGLISLIGEGSDGTNGSLICSSFGGTATNVSGAVINSGVIRLTVASTGAFATGNYVRVDGIGGAVNANGTWAVTVIDGTHLDLINSGSSLGSAYTSGGTVQLPGYVLDAHSTGGETSLYRIRGLGVKNDNLAGGGIIWGDVATGGLYESFVHAGLLGIDLSTNVFVVEVKDTQIIGSDNTGTGLYMGQVNVTGNSFTGWDLAIATRNVGQPICGNRFEVNNIAILLGGKPGFAGADSASGIKLCSNSYERNLVGIYAQSISNSSFDGETITGTIGPDYLLTGTSTWLAGTVTATSLRPHHQSGTQNCNIENATPSGYNTGSHVSCTFSGTNTITYPIVSNPGANTNAGAWAIEIGGGIVVCNVQQTTIINTAITINPFAAGGFGIDFKGCGGFTAQSYNSIISSGLGTYNLPAGVDKAGWVAINGNSANQISLNMVFADLPGQAGVHQTPALLGSVYDITDCGTVTWGANASGGSAGTHCRVWYNGANWTVIGK